ncbi:tetratricopeptide repeat protein [Vibrio cholerae]|nr:tetratricopeptide repeat protein [Vibrio cholerae]EJL6549177.1 tetratricopeptide repeat protein [Vibrio cholerae]EKF9573048.1 tetratricopeptide repeat protein [Vibrio cholerae]ELB8601949.1 tetratricopeptide repeat protein [Vibrio cholerae]HDL9492443.1 tetratricopeptide repeat protein [Vibrio cholerae]
MSKKPFWQVPQNWIIASLVVGIAGYFAYQEFSKPKVNRLQQASAYFDALEAEERAEAEKQAALKAKQQAEQALAQAAQAKKEAQAAQERANQAQTQKQQMYAQNARNWVLNKLDWCVDHNDEWSTKFCNVTCVNGNGDYKTKQGVWVNFVAGSWQGPAAPGFHASPTIYYQAVCANL